MSPHSALIFRSHVCFVPRFRELDLSPGLNFSDERLARVNHQFACTELSLSANYLTLCNPYRKRITLFAFRIQLIIANGVYPHITFVHEELDMPRSSYLIINVNKFCDLLIGVGGMLIDVII